MLCPPGYEHGVKAEIVRMMDQAPQELQFAPHISWRFERFYIPYLRPLLSRDHQKVFKSYE